MVVLTKLFIRQQPPPSTVIQCLLPFVTTESRHFFILKRSLSSRVIFCSVRKLFFSWPLRIQAWYLSGPAVLIFQQQRFPNSFCTALFVNKKNLLSPTFILYIFCWDKLQLVVDQNKMNKVTKQRQQNYEKLFFHVVVLKDAWFVQLSSLIWPHLYFCTNFLLIYWIFFKPVYAYCTTRGNIYTFPLNRIYRTPPYHRMRRSRSVTSWLGILV